LCPATATALREMDRQTGFLLTAECLWLTALEAGRLGRCGFRDRRRATL